MHSLYYNGTSTVTQSLFFLALGLAIFLPGTGNADRHLLTTYSISVIYIVGSMSGIRDLIGKLREANRSVRRINELDLRLNLACDSATTVRGRSTSPSNTIGTLSLAGVTISYKEKTLDQQLGHFTLGPIDLTLKSGEIVFVVGKNGSGKTTLAKVLLGLYVPKAGRIWLDGTEINDGNRDWYSGHFSAIFSDFYLFDHLIETDQSFHSSRVLPLLQRFKIDQKVGIRPDGMLSTTTALSVGERKRLALTLAYIEDKPAYIFDEWAADQDPAFKEFFYKQALNELKSRQKLVVVISHDDRYFGLADKIIALDQTTSTQADDVPSRRPAGEPVSTELLRAPPG